MVKNKIIAIDFDGTIVKHEFPRIGELMHNAKEVIKEIKENGNIIILWTCRTAEYLNQATAFMCKNDIPFDFVNENIPSIKGFGEPKIVADIYIDDRDIGGFLGWKRIKEILNKTEGHGK